MQILSTSYGLFPAVRQLSQALREDALIFKMVLVISDDDGAALTDFAATYARLTDILPTFSHHRCCANNDHENVHEVEGVPLRRSDPLADCAHLVEHVILDVAVRLTRSDTLSGVTCGYVDPPNYHDVFVECPRREVALFASHFAIEIVSDAIREKPLDRYRTILFGAAAYADGGFDRLALARLPDELEMSEDEAVRLVSELRRLGLISD